MRLAHKVALSAAAVGALLLPGVPVAFSATSGTTGPTETYLVLYKQQAVPADAATRIQKAGGSLVTAYDAIGVAVARSNNSAFSGRLATDSRVEGATATTKFASKLAPDQADASTGDLPNAPATDADTFSSLQWDMRQIHTPQAHAITGGSPAVVVGDIDTGLDFNHPDLAPNYDAARSADCSSGVATPLLPGNDKNGHGTHTAGTIAAASNGIGIVGVAPNVKIAGIKSSNDDGYFFPEMVVCSFMWAGSHGIDVTNNSYFADPWQYNCKNDPVQRAIWKAEQRAIRYAQQQGVTVVASAGNDSDDVSHPTTDVTSPDFPPETNVTREVTNACVVIPLEISGVVGVSATGSTTQGTAAGQYEDNLKSYYSSFGISAVDVTAPGGDRRFVAPGVVNGRVLSTWSSTAPCRVPGPADPSVPLARYCWAQGTSMAGPHVAGVAALIVSRYGSLSSPGNGTMQPGKVASVLGQSADPQACPNSLPTSPFDYLSFRGVNSGAVQSCQGGPGHNSWYGNGQVDALNAVTKTSGNQ